jgi:dipeptidyl aminopeptidase/acylaminoacyl peptidase
MSRRRRAGWRTNSTYLLLGVLPVLGQLPACRSGGNGRGPTTELISVSVHDGTWLAFDLSPDHEHIAFDMLGQLWLMPAAGGVAHAVTDAVRDSAEDGDPAFSPDGKSLVFAGERAGHPGLWRVDIASGRVDRLTTAPEADDQPAWSPDGATIAFVRQSAKKQDNRVVGGAWLNLLDVASGEIRLLPFRPKGSYNIRDPAWSADGKTIYLVVPKQSYPATVSGGSLWSIDVAKGTRALVDSSLEILAPSPSPDSHALAFVAKDSAGKAQVWIRGLPEGEPRRLTNEAELTPRRLRWLGPDTLLFVSGGRFRRQAITGTETTEVPFVATVAFPRKVSPLPARHFPAPGSRQPARGQTGLTLAPDGSRAAMIALRRLWIIPIPTGTPKEVARLPEERGMWIGLRPWIALCTPRDPGVQRIFTFWS